MSIATNIIKGVYKRLNRKEDPPRFEKLNWSRIKLLKHQDNFSIKKFIVNGQTILYKRPYELMHTYSELFEHEIYRFTSVRPAPFIIDCGANIGLSVLYFKAIYPNASITAFEPDEDNFKLLIQNIEANNLKHVQPVKAAVWKEDTTLRFAAGGSQGSKISGDTSEAATVNVQAVRLANLLKEKKVDFLKIDIEGAEDAVLQDCAPYLQQVSNLFLEYHGRSDETEKLISLLQIVHDNGFKTYIKMAADDLRFPFEDKHTGNSFDVQLNLFCYR